MRLASVGLKKSVDQPLQTVGFRNDDLGVLALIAILQFGFQKLGCTPDAAERVFHFVSKVAQKRTRCLSHPSFLLLSDALNGFLYRHNFQKHAAFAFGNARKHDLHRFGVGKRPTQFGYGRIGNKLLVLVGKALGPFAHMCNQESDVGSLEIAPRAADEHFCRGVAPEHARIAIEHHDTRGQQVRRSLKPRVKGTAASAHYRTLPQSCAFKEKR